MYGTFGAFEITRRAQYCTISTWSDFSLVSLKCHTGQQYPSVERIKEKKMRKRCGAGIPWRANSFRDLMAKLAFF